MRLFVAIDIPQALKAGLAGIQQGLRPLPLRPVDPSSMHLTLKFLGEIEQERLEELKKRLSGLAPPFTPLTIATAAFGTFPHVFWLGIEASPELLSLHNAIETACLPFASKDAKGYAPHLTIARFNDPQLAHLLKNRFAGKSLAVSWKAASLILYESTLTPQGPLYRQAHVVRAA